MFLDVFYAGIHRGPHARGRARVTMVARLCARVEHSVWFRIEKSPCWLGNSSETLAVTDWISKLALVLPYVLYCGNHRGPHARGRARVTVVIRLCARAKHSVQFRIGKSPCWLGDSREPLAVADGVFQVSTCFFDALYAGIHRGPHARGRARMTMVTRLCAHVEHSVLFRIEKSP